MWVEKYKIGLCVGKSGYILKPVATSPRTNTGTQKTPALITKRRER
jgi:hypothetical protein